MYSAIVFLPLLGAIIAGAISIFGAHERTRPAVTNGHGHRRGRGHGEGENGADEHGHDHEPAAVGSRQAEYITSGFLIISAVLSWIAFFTVGLGDEPTQRYQVFNWFSSGTLSVDWALRIDTLTVVMLVVVNTVSSVVHVYSIGYMSHDPNRPRFFAYLSLFTFAMLSLVTADNLVQLFFGWEGVGLASYLLIGFWYQRPAANAAAIKAFVVNRVGDFGFALGIFAVFVVFNSVEFETIFANAPTIAGTRMQFLSWNVDTMTVICLLLFLGAMGKSAQFLLHTWLPDAMEGPTPVSALIHAATMVTAGVFMVARLSPLFEQAPTALAFVTLIGGTTAFFAATIGLVQNDIKRVIAYSTCSQLGYMFVAMGVGAYSIGMFHLFTHAFFKALLFLGAGSVIHAMSDEQDMRKMGGLRKVIPKTYWMMVIGSLALTGFPLTAGYYSKDAIIEASFVGTNTFAGYAFVMSTAAAMLTAFYSWRLIFMTFHGKPRASAEVMNHAHESPLVMLVPLYVLGLGALFGGMVFYNFFIGTGFEDFWKGAVFFSEENHTLEEMHHIPFWVVWAPTTMMVIGTAIAYWFYMVNTDVPKQLAARNDWLYRFLLNKWYFDELYDFLFVRSLKWLGRFLWKRGDGWLIDGFGPDGVSARVMDTTARIVKLQSGYLYHYAFAMLIGVAFLVTYLMFAA
ncbi:MAG: NADH-quinone oxidoreductase subunit L [Bauldia sp.]|uniref:NADH-quinone oxidoreductase subunit L n=1 Tax=Bauldia sp. TaxID=2575872 RepID=UPI001DEE437F|nr:NADH-quinone oxidoreductase subunit L [Bauldia sp.]MCB1495666.1 NADH-quinone oxidoreductase subunit L [Bauldia sp.]